jgi:hypothetical protein
MASFASFKHVSESQALPVLRVLAQPLNEFPLFRLDGEDRQTAQIQTFIESVG